MIRLLCFGIILIILKYADSAQTSSKDSNHDKQSLKTPTQSSSSSSSSSKFPKYILPQIKKKFNFTSYPIYPAHNFNPLSPLVKCSFLPAEFIECHPLLDHKGNKTAKDLVGHGCVKYGGSYHEDVEHSRALCEALPDIECYGERTFWRDGFPCVKHSDHLFVTTLIYSIFLGFLGMDRFCLVSERANS